MSTELSHEATVLSCWVDLQLSSPISKQATALLHQKQQEGKPIVPLRGQLARGCASRNGRRSGRKLTSLGTRYSILTTSIYVHLTFTTGNRYLT